MDILGPRIQASEIRLQASDISRIDDILILGRDEHGEVHGVSIGCRRMPKFVPSDIKTTELVGQFLKMIDENFDALASNRWRLGLASEWDIGTQQIRTLAELAKSCSEADFYVQARDVARTPRKTADRLTQLVRQVDKTLETLVLTRNLSVESWAWILLSRLHFHNLELSATSGGDRTAAVAALRRALRAPHVATADDLFARLVDHTADYAQQAARITREKLVADLNLRQDLIQVSALSSDYVLELSRDLLAHRRASRRSLGLNDNQIDATLELSSDVPDELSTLADGELLVVTGPLGSGKSDVAARWLLDGCQNFSAVALDRVPVQVIAKLMTENLTESVLAALPDAGLLETHGVSLHLDGVEEAGSPEELLVEADAFVMRNANSAVVATSRPGSYIPRGFKQYRIEQLDASDVETLVGCVVDNPHMTMYRWSDAVRQSACRPLFALMAAALSSTPGAGIGMGQLIEQAVRKALSGRVPPQSLRRLAVATLESGFSAAAAQVLDEDELAGALATHLIVENRGRLSFVLPIFEQWFAAQSVLRAETNIEICTADMGAFNRWRYVLSLALSVGARESINPIVRALLEWRVGAAMWVLNESAQRHKRGESNPLPPMPTVASAIREAYDALFVALGEAQAVIYRFWQVEFNPQQLTLQVYSQDTSISEIWKVSGPGDKRVELLAEELVLFGAREMDPNELWIRHGPVADDEAWAWRWALDDISSRLKKNLGNMAGLTPRADRMPVFKEEYEEWLVNLRSRNTGPRQKTPSAIRKSLRDLVTFTTDDGDEVEVASMNYNGHTIDVGLTLALSKASDGRIESLIAGRYPREDRHPVGARWVWDYYSNEQLLAWARAVYESAILVYAELCETYFSGFEETLRHRATTPANLKLFLAPVPEGADRDIGPTVWYKFYPDLTTDQPAGKISLTVENAQDASLSDMHDSLSTTYEQFRRLKPNRAVFGSMYSGSSRLELHPDAPATRLALSWLWDDFKALGWNWGAAPYNVV